MGSVATRPSRCAQAPRARRRRRATATTPTRRCTPAPRRFCNGHDDDCDGISLDGTAWYPDADGDGQGVSTGKTVACDPPAGFVADDGDCDDANPSVHAGATEVCDDGVDDDCDGKDRACGGFDGEHSLDEADAQLSCEQPSWDAGRLVETGDLTGDGMEDLLVATLHGDGSTGGAYVVPGPVAGSASFDDVAHRISSVLETGGAGRSMGIGDLDGDGYADMGFGAPYAQHNGMYVLFGPTTGDRSLADADVSLTIDRTNLWSGHGSDVADVTGDGIADAVIGAPYDDTGPHWSGTLFVERGPIDDGDFDLYEDADATIAGYEANAEVGRFLLAGPDVNGDGIGDIAVGAPWSAYAGPTTGGVFVVYGPPEIASMADADGWLPGPAPNAYAGVGFTLGDWNGDGNADVAVWAQEPELGGVYVVEGPVSGVQPLEDAETVITGTTDQFGTGLGSGDLDGDGVEDLLVGDTFAGVPENAGVTYLVSLPPTGTSVVEDIARATFLGTENGDASGQGIGVGDLDADGRGDVLIGAPWAAAGGAAYVFYGE